MLGYSRYLQEFVTTGLKFGKYSVDECATCTMLKEQMDADPDNDDLKLQKAKHLREADISYAQQTFDYALSQKNTGTESVWFDMAAVIQIPKLATGKAFYLRKYKTYMEGFHMGSTKQNHLYCWGQKDGNKGSIEVVSALYMLINQHVEATRKHLILNLDGQHLISKQKLEHATIHATPHRSKKPTLQIRQSVTEICTSRAHVQPLRSLVRIYR